VTAMELGKPPVLEPEPALPEPVEAVPDAVDAGASLLAGLDATIATFSATGTLETASLTTADAAPEATAEVAGVDESAVSAGAEALAEPPDTAVAAPQDEGGWMTAGWTVWIGLHPGRVSRASPERPMSSVGVTIASM